ncbi:MAG: acyl-CoA thioesterase [Muribaculaceae bacterium]|nr:acyl-CoA thioesterase [Muribaculaceae bacterium]
MTQEDINPEAFRHTTPVQLRFNDIDMLGHVNNNAQFALFDVGKTQFYNTLATKVAPDDWSRVEAVIVNINCTFMRQIKFTYPMEVRTRVKHIGEKSFILEQILRNTETGEICTSCESVMVAIDFETRESKPLDPTLVDALAVWS